MVTLGLLRDHNSVQFAWRDSISGQDYLEKTLEGFRWVFGCFFWASVDKLRPKAPIGRVSRSAGTLEAHHETPMNPLYVFPSSRLAVAT